MQQNFFMVEIEHETESLDGKADISCLGLGSDGNSYSLKRLSDESLLPATEWVCHTLCRTVGIATPDFLQVKRKSGDIAFATRIEESAFRIQPHVKGQDPIQVQIARTFSSTVILHSRIYGLDAAVGNPARGLPSFLFRQTPFGLLPMATDFKKAWVIQEKPFGTVPWEQYSLSSEVSKYFYKLGVFEAPEARDTIEKLCALPDSILQDALNTCHPTWVQGHDWTPTLDMWAQRHSQLKLLAMQNFNSMP